MKTEHAPVEAFRFDIGKFEIGDNGDDAKSHPFRMMARTAMAIEHWFFGKIEHDLSGFKIPGGRDRIVIDMNHDDSVQLGYANKFSVTDEGLVLSGALTPYRDGDKSSEIAAKAKAGVPYEASINFAGESLFEHVAQGETSEVNGHEFTGPGVIVRKWLLRSAAICPSGADPSCSTQMLSEASEIPYSIQEHEKMTKKLNEQENPISDEATEVVDSESVEDSDEAVTTDDDQSSDETAVESQEPAIALSADEGAKMVKAFGPRGAVAFVDGKSYEETMAELFAEQQTELGVLRKKLAAFESGSEEAASFSEIQDKDKADGFPINRR